MLEEQQVGQGYESHPFITPAQAKKFKRGKVINAPREGKTKFGTKVFIDLQLDSKTKVTWSANPTSSNFLIRNFGKDEKKWIGKTIIFEVVNQLVGKKRRDVIYAKGSVDSE